MQSARSIRLAISLLMQETCPLPVYYGFDYLPDLKRLRAAGDPFVFMDHAYFERGYDKGNFRVLFNQIHQAGIYPDLPADRMPKKRDWKQGSKVYIIPVPPNIADWHNAHSWTVDTLLEVKRNTDREVIVKPKNGTPLLDLVPDAWAVVSHSSVAAVEAATNGVPVFGPETSPAYHVGLPSLCKIETPIFPDRDAWLKTLSYSQFTIDEIRSGRAWAILKELNGL